MGSAEGPQTTEEILPFPGARYAAESSPSWSTRDFARWHRVLGRAGICWLTPGCDSPPLLRSAMRLLRRAWGRGGLITKRGIALRLGSVGTHAPIPALPVAPRGRSSRQLRLQHRQGLRRVHRFLSRGRDLGAGPRQGGLQAVLPRHGHRRGWGGVRGGGLCQTRFLCEKRIPPAARERCPRFGLPRCSAASSGFHAFKPPALPEIDARCLRYRHCPWNPLELPRWPSSPPPR